MCEGLLMTESRSSFYLSNLAHHSFSSSTSVHFPLFWRRFLQRFLFMQFLLCSFALVSCNLLYLSVALSNFGSCNMLSDLTSLMALRRISEFSVFIFLLLIMQWQLPNSLHEKSKPVSYLKSSDLRSFCKDLIDRVSS